MQLRPLPCVGCRRLVEPSGMNPDGMQFVDERRLRPGETFFSAPMCWDCRGAVLLDMPPASQLLHPGAPGAVDVRCAHLGAKHVPIIRLIRATD
jgi:hypothetical protein